MYGKTRAQDCVVVIFLSIWSIAGCSGTTVDPVQQSISCPPGTKLAEGQAVCIRECETPAKQEENVSGDETGCTAEALQQAREEIAALKAQIDAASIERAGKQAELEALRGSLAEAQRARARMSRQLKQAQHAAAEARDEAAMLGRMNEEQKQQLAEARRALDEHLAQQRNWALMAIW